MQTIDTAFKVRMNDEGLDLLVTEGQVALDSLRNQEFDAGQHVDIEITKDSLLTSLNIDEEILTADEFTLSRIKS